MATCCTAQRNNAVTPTSMVLAIMQVPICKYKHGAVTCRSSTFRYLTHTHRIMRMILRACMPCRGVQCLSLLVVMLTGPAEASVQICSAGDYLTARGVCLACPQGRLSVLGATSIDQCLCQPVVEVVATAPFPGLTQDATVSQTVLDMWAAEGVVSWVLGASGQSCTDACADNNFLCSDNLDSSMFQSISVESTWSSLQ